MENMEKIKKLLLGGYNISDNYLKQEGITLDGMLKAISYEEDMNSKIKMLRKLDIIYPNNYDVVKMLMYVHVGNREYMEAYHEGKILEDLSSNHDKDTYRIMKVLITYYNVAGKHKLPDVYEMGKNYKDSYKKWDTINSQMFAGDPIVHDVYSEINNVILDRYISNMGYTDDFYSILEKLYYDGFTITVRAEICIYLKQNGLSEYQDFFMWLFLHKDPDIIEYLDSITRMSRLNANEILSYLEDAIKNGDRKKALYYRDLLGYLPKDKYPENDMKFNDYLINRYDANVSGLEYKDMRFDRIIEENAKSLSENKKEYVRTITNEFSLAKLEYLLKEYGIEYNYTFDGENYRVIFNTTSKTYYEDDASETIEKRTKRLLKELNTLKK